MAARGFSKDKELSGNCMETPSFFIKSLNCIVLLLTQSAHKIPSFHLCLLSTEGASPLQEGMPSSSLTPEIICEEACWARTTGMCRSEAPELFPFPC